MKIINIGILAHVDAGKTTLTESLLYTSGAIAEQGNVDKGTTRTDTMILERQRGITIQTAVTSFCWNGYKINIVDTPGHMDFLTEAYRSLSVLDGAVLVISAKDGVQAQTRILFHALQKMNIPTIIFVNKIDQNGIDLRRVYQSIKDKLTSDMIVMQEVALSPKITITDISDLDKWDIIISGNDELLERYVAEDSLDIQELQYEKCKRTRCCSLFPVYHGSAKDNLGTEKLIEAITETFITETDDIQSELCGYVFKVEYTERKKRLSYLRLYHGTLHLRDTLLLSKKKKIKITEMCIPSNGEIVPADHLYILCFTTNYNGNANYEGGGTFYVEGSADIEDGRVSGNGYLSINGHSCPAIKRVIELGKVYDVDSNSKPDKTWQYLDVDAAYVYGDMSMKSVEVPVDGLKVGDTIRATAMSLKVNMDYTSESYFFNTGNILYGWVFDGSGWYQLQDEYDYGYMGEKELSSESPFVSECGLFDYETPNKLTIKISCKRNGYLTVEWSDQAGGYIEMMPLYNFQVLR